MHTFMRLFSHVCMCIHVYVYVYVWIYVCIMVCMYHGVCMHVCMYVCIYVCVSWFSLGSSANQFIDTERRDGINGGD